MREIDVFLFENKDEGYADFCANLTPGLDREKFIGVRTPVLRKFAKNISRTEMGKAFLKELPHRYYEENQLHGFIISETRDFETAILEMEDFLPYIDNWATCDTTKPKAFAKNTDRLLPYLEKWIQSEHTYTVRYAIDSLMNWYLDEHFDPKYLRMVSEVSSEEYYVNMMIAWYFATALAKQWDSAIVYLENKSMPKWTHNKTIQKARESFRITDEQKEYLKTLRQ